MKNQNRFISILLILCFVVAAIPAAQAYSYGIADVDCDNHQWSAWESEDDDVRCGEFYSRWRVCEKCGEWEGEEIMKTHTFGPWTVLREATEDMPGDKVRVCTNCGERENIADYPENVPHEGTKNSPEVYVAQSMLKDLGYYQAAATGDYFNGLTIAVSNFQKENGLAVSGALFRPTRDEINRHWQIWLNLPDRLTEFTKDKYFDRLTPGRIRIGYISNRDGTHQVMLNGRKIKTENCVFALSRVGGRLIAECSKCHFTKTVFINNQVRPGFDWNELDVTLVSCWGDWISNGDGTHTRYYTGTGTRQYPPQTENCHTTSAINEHHYATCADCGSLFFVDGHDMDFLDCTMDSCCKMTNHFWCNDCQKEIWITVYTGEDCQNDLFIMGHEDLMFGEFEQYAQVGCSVCGARTGSASCAEEFNGECYHLDYGYATVNRTGCCEHEFERRVCDNCGEAYDLERWSNPCEETDRYLNRIWFDGTYYIVLGCPKCGKEYDRVPADEYTGEIPEDHTYECRHNNGMREIAFECNCNEKTVYYICDTCEELMSGNSGLIDETLPLTPLVVEDSDLIHVYKTEGYCENKNDLLEEYCGYSIYGCAKCGCVYYIMVTVMDVDHVPTEALVKAEELWKYNLCTSVTAHDEGVKEEDVCLYRVSYCANCAVTPVCVGVVLHDWKQTDEIHYCDGDLTFYECSLCGEKNTAFKSNGGQCDYAATVIKDCGGTYTEYTCKVCGNSYIIKPDDYNDDLHDYVLEGLAPIGDPDICCGRAYYKCSVCGAMTDETYENAEIIIHDYVFYEDTSTCNTKGETRYICTKCGHIVSGGPNDHYGHEWELVTTTTDECVEYELYRCALCGEEANIIVGENHDYKATGLTYSVTCEVECVEYVCTRCGKQHVERQATGKTCSYEADETDTGDYYGGSGYYMVSEFCTECGAARVSYKPRFCEEFGHDWHSGFSSWYCTACGEIRCNQAHGDGPQDGEHQFIATDRHNVLNDYTEYRCKDCGYTKYATAENNEHVWEIISEEHIAGCPEKGDRILYQARCLVCGIQVLFEDDANDHERVCILENTWYCPVCGQSGII